MGQRLSLRWQFQRFFALLALSGFLAGCAANKPVTATSWEFQQNRLMSLTQWTAQGKIALRNDRAAESATLRWQQDIGQSRLKLSGPLGMGTTHISSDGEQLQVVQGKERRVIDISTPEAIFRNTGWHLPLKALPFWLKGVPSPDYPIEELATDEDTLSIQSLEQDGWQVTYSAHAAFESFTLPTRIEAQRDGMRLKVIVRTWQNLGSL